MKVVINTCFGGFGLSKEALETYYTRKGFAVVWNLEDRDEDRRGKYTGFVDFPYDAKTKARFTDLWPAWPARTDPVLIAVVEELGNRANGKYAKLKVIEIPDGISWYISDYDGVETIEEEHRSWC